MRHKISIRPSVIKMLLAVSFILCFASCSQKNKIQSENTLDRIRRTGVIDACTVVDPPEVMKDSKTGLFSGEAIDIMNLIAQKINAKVNWHETTWGNATAELQARHCDVVAAYLWADIERAQTVAFTHPLVYIGVSVLARKNDPRFQHIKDIASLNRPDVTVAVATGDGDILTKQFLDKAQVRRVDVESGDLSRFCVEVSAHRADLAISDSNTIGLYVKAHPETVDLFRARPFGLTPSGWAVRQDDFQWLHFLDTALQFLETQGTLAQLDKKYDAYWLHEDRHYKLQ